MDSLVGRIKILNLEVIDLNYQFFELLDNDFFNFDKAVKEKANLQLTEIEEKVMEIYQSCYENHGQLGGSLQDTIDTIWDYDSAEIYAIEDLKLEFQDLIFEDDHI